VYASGNDGVRLYINGEILVDRWSGFSWNRENILYDFRKGQVYEFVVEHFNRSGSTGLELQFENLQISNPDEIRNADCVVVCLGHDSQTEKENFDRTFALPQGQEEYLRKVLAINKNVVVVLNAGGGIDMSSWINDVKAVLMAWYPGQQGGLAVSEIITGKVSPSGRLPISIEKSVSDNPTSETYYENVDRIRTPNINPYSRVEYREGLFMGYRGYHKNRVEPLFPFGFGLSYTTFEYSDIAVKKEEDKYVLTFNVKNAGKVACAEVAQVYVGDDQSSLARPEMELKGFEKVFLHPGESTTVSITLDSKAFRFFDPYIHDFVVEPGTFTAYVGASSSDIRLRLSFDVE
jgi:beta-glucosidase